MQRRDQDPNYQLHDLSREADDRDGPRNDAAGQEDQGSTDELQEVNRRINAREADPEAVRETEREHGSPNAPREP